MTDIVELRDPQDDDFNRCRFDEIEQLRALLRELIDIEGPQPGTAGWAAKVRAALTAGNVPSHKRGET